MYNKVRRLGLSKYPAFCLQGMQISSSLLGVQKLYSRFARNFESSAQLVT